MSFNSEVVEQRSNEFMVESEGSLYRYINDKPVAFMVGHASITAITQS